MKNKKTAYQLGPGGGLLQPTPLRVGCLHAARYKAGGGCTEQLAGAHENPRWAAEGAGRMLTAPGYFQAVLPFFFQHIIFNSCTPA